MFAFFVFPLKITAKEYKRHRLTRSNKRGNDNRREMPTVGKGEKGQMRGTCDFQRK